MAMTIQKMHQMMNPLYGITVDGPTLKPLWSPMQKFSLLCFINHSPRFSPFKISDLRNKDLLLMFKKGLVFDFNEPEIDIRLRLEQEPEMGSKPSSALRDKEITAIVSRRVWDNIRSNSSAVYLHVLVMQEDKETDDITSSLIRSGTALYSVIKMIKYDVIPKYYQHRYLLGDFNLNPIPVDTVDVIRSQMRSDTIISYWKPEVAVRLVTDFSEYPEDYGTQSLSPVVPNALMKTVIHPKQSGLTEMRYAPPVHADEIGLTSDKYVPLNDTVTELPLRLSLGPMSLQRWLLMQHMELSLSSQSGLGFSDKDIDDVRRLISDTSVYLLGITFLASLLHLLFEALAFQSDISFWQHNTSLAGLSARTVITDLFTQMVVFLYLLESDTSLLVTIPALIGIGIQMWKVWRATGICLRWKGLVPSIHFSRWEKELLTLTMTEEKKKTIKGIDDTTVSEVVNGDIDRDGQSQQMAKTTLEADRQATLHLSALLLPLVLGLAAKSLVMDKHPSWYSWGIGALTACVYAFGFIMMCPQLFINHKLKSVAFLPWNFLMYRFINTFIDGKAEQSQYLFAFIIKMPTMHRISCFRDDLVFLVYMYQRWIYRVDTARPMEK
eukprot:gene1211-2358_t